MIGLILWLGCTDKGDDAATADSGLTDTATDTNTSTSLPVADGCRAQPADADRDRLVVLGLPYDDAANAADTWAALTLTADGELLDDGARFTMGRGLWGKVAFSPDGSLGVAPQDDGSMGIFTVDEAGTVTVVDARYDPGIYAVAAAVDPTGEAVWIVDGNWVENGGGLYRIPLDCETGIPGEPELALTIKLGVDLMFLKRQLDRAVVVGWEADGAGDLSAEVHLLAMGTDATVLSSGEAFGDDEALLSAAAVTWDDRYALVADFSPWSGINNRIAAVDLSADPPVAVASLDLYDPVAILPSPFDDLLLVSSGYGDAIESISYDPDDSIPFAVGRRIADSALPADGVVITRGGLIGLALVTENQGVRGVQFEGDGTATDLGRLLYGDGLDAIPGSIGVQP